jgi:uncharacterized membrane protein
MSNYQPHNLSQKIALYSYLTIIGTVIAYNMMRKQVPDDHYCRFHIRQATGVFVLALLGVIPYAGPVFGLIAFVLWAKAMLDVLNTEMKPLPIVGKPIQQLLAKLI